MSAGRIPLTLAPGTVKEIVTTSPAREAETCSGATGTLASGTSGGPFLPHADASGRVAHAATKRIRAAAERRVCAAITGNTTTRSQDVARQIFVADDVVEHAADVRVVDRHRLVGEVRPLERDLVEQLFHHGMEAPRPDVFRLVVDFGGERRNAIDGLLGESERDALGVEQRDVLLDQRVLRLREDAHEVVAPERLELHANGKTALQLGDEVGRLGDVERAGSDEEDVIGPYHPVLRVHRRALHDRQDVPLHALPAHVGTLATLAPGDLVDLVHENDAALLDALHRGPGDAVHVDQLLFFFLGDLLQRFGHLQLPLPRTAAEHPRHHLLQVDADLLDGGARDDLERRERLVADVDLDRAMIETPGAELLAEAFARVLGR